MQLVATNLKSTSEAAAILGIGRDAVLMAATIRKTLAIEHTVEHKGKIVAYLFHPDELERYARENQKIGRPRNSNTQEPPK